METQITAAPVLPAYDEARERMEKALHEISLCSQNSASSKEECGRIARAALMEGQ